MKSILSLLATLFLGISCYSQTADEVTIKDVLTKETTAFFKRDFKTSFSYWHIIPQSVAIVSMADGEVLRLTDKELNAAYTANALQSNIFPDSFGRSLWLFKINGNAAFVSFEQSVFTEKKITGKTYECRYMEKINGQWKIVAMTVVNVKQ